MPEPTHAEVLAALSIPFFSVCFVSVNLVVPRNSKFGQALVIETTASSRLTEHLLAVLGCQCPIMCGVLEVEVTSWVSAQTRWSTWKRHGGLSREDSQSFAEAEEFLCIWVLLLFQVYTQIHNLWMLGSTRRVDHLGLHMQARGRSAAEEDLQCNTDLWS